MAMTTIKRMALLREKGATLRDMASGFNEAARMAHAAGHITLAGQLMDKVSEYQRDANECFEQSRRAGQQ